MTPAGDARDLRLGADWTRRQRLKNDVIHALAIAAIAVIVRLPRRIVAHLCRAIGALACRLLSRERALCEARLVAGLGEPVPTARVRGAFVRAGETLADTLALLDPHERAARTLALDPDGARVFRDALACGRGVVFISAHLGSWERMAALLAEEGFPVATVARESYDPRFTALYDRLRAPRGVRSIYRGRPGAAAAIVRELRAGRAVGFLVDLPGRVPCARAPLFGALADIPLGAARIALARRAEVIVGTCAPEGRVRITRVETDDLPAGRAGEPALVERIAAELDARIRVLPEAWLGLFTPPHRAEDAAPIDASIVSL
ncbi:Lipid A biosynthesis lauroyl acyltransferase [Minicystis rosea]|nr:Lipid A biosynthesis lauroyl acyltransferase [Minicystis rosea]